MKASFAVLLLARAYNVRRIAWAEQALASLVKTYGWEAVSLYGLFFDESDRRRLLSVMPSFPGAMELEVTGLYASQPNVLLAYGTEQAFRRFPTADKIVWAYDDMLCHPAWLEQLDELIARHPQATAWSVYRSAHVAHHCALEQRGGDVRVRSLDGMSLCLSRDEWQAYAVRWQTGDFTVPTGGCSIDLHHAYYRSGERWCTGQSWVQNLGRAGIHTVETTPAYGMNFVGDGEARRSA